MIDVRFRPIDSWPGVRTTRASRRPSRFRLKYSDSLELLERELRYLRARDIVIQAAFRLEQIRNDGWPRATATSPEDPGVIVSFASPKGQMSFPCDRYTNWHENLRAIALSLEALRAVDRYGVTQHEEQYKGWTALPAAGPAKSSMTRDDAARFLTTHGCIHVSANHTDVAAVDAAYKRAARSLHPDAGGDHELFVRLQVAMRTLKGEG